MSIGVCLKLVLLVGNVLVVRADPDVTGGVRVHGLGPLALGVSRVPLIQFYTDILK